MQRNDLMAKQKAPLAAIAAVEYLPFAYLAVAATRATSSACASKRRPKPPRQAVCAMASDPPQRGTRKTW
jgi:hypothetical protein